MRRNLSMPIQSAEKYSWKTFSVVTFGNELEVRIRIACEAVLNSSIYLNSECLNRGSFSINIVKLYALTSPVFNSMNRKEQNLNTEKFTTEKL